MATKTKIKFWKPDGGWGKADVDGEGGKGSVFIHHTVVEPRPMRGEDLTDQEIVVDGVNWHAAKGPRAEKVQLLIGSRPAEGITFKRGKVVVLGHYDIELEDRKKLPSGYGGLIHWGSADGPLAFPVSCRRGQGQGVTFRRSKEGYKAPIAVWTSETEYIDFPLPDPDENEAVVAYDQNSTPLAMLFGRRFQGGTKPIVYFDPDRCRIDWFRE